MRESSNFGTQGADIFIPSDHQKLQKIFPYIDQKQLEEVLKECDSDLNKAYVKIHSKDSQLHSGQIVTDSDSSISSMSVTSNSFPKKYSSNILSGAHSTSFSCFAGKPRESKKRGRDQLDSSYNQQTSYIEPSISNSPV